MARLAPIMATGVALASMSTVAAAIAWPSSLDKRPAIDANVLVIDPTNGVPRQRL